MTTIEKLRLILHLTDDADVMNAITPHVYATFAGQGVRHGMRSAQLQFLFPTITDHERDLILRAWELQEALHQALDDSNDEILTDDDREGAKAAEVEARPRFDALCSEINKIIQQPGALTPEQVELIDEILPDAPLEIRPHSARIDDHTPDENP